MTQYIDKDAVVAEIESLKCTTFTNFDEGVNCAVQTLLEIIDTIEVKEVDLEKELDRYTNSAEYIYSEMYDSYFLVAKHFYELGLKATQNEHKSCTTDE